LTTPDDPVVVRRRGGRILLDVRLPGSSVRVRVTVSTTDLEDVWDILCRMPGFLGSAIVGALFSEELAPARPRPRGRQANRTVPGSRVRWLATKTYAVVERVMAADAAELLEAIRRHAERERPDIAESMKTMRGRWNKRELTAYILELGFEIGIGAFTGTELSTPMSAPEQLYQDYIKGAGLRAARETLDRWPDAYPFVWTSLAKLVPGDVVARARAAVAGQIRGESTGPKPNG
jgi:hypothetical protein